MPLQGELDYYRNMDPLAFAHAANKPWSDEFCGRYLMEIGALAELMPRQGRLLDLGCGTGWTSFLFAAMGYEVVGQDVAPEAIAFAQKTALERPALKASFVVSDYESLRFASEFDVAVFFDSLHHAVNETDAVASAYRALRPGGVLITSEPGRGHARQSRQEVERFGVTERDMQPSRVIRAGRAAGFSSFEVYPHATHLGIALYGRPRRRPLIGRLLRLPGVRALAACFDILLYKRADGIVLMRK
jgi:SAM-dependent methyltransferase